MGMATRLSDENRGHLTSLESRLHQTVVKTTHRRQEHFYFDFKHANERLPTGLSIGGHGLPLDGGGVRGVRWHRSFQPPDAGGRRRRHLNAGPPSATGGPLRAALASLPRPTGQQLLLSYAPSQSFQNVPRGSH